MGYPLHLIDLLAKLYRKQLAKVKVAGTLSEWFPVKKGVRQGCVLSPYLFNILAEMVMRETLDGFQGGLQIGGRMITNLRYADDIILLATSEAELQELVDRLDRVSRRYSLLINIDKTKVMASDGIACHILIQNEQLAQVNMFPYLGSLITEDGECTFEVHSKYSNFILFEFLDAVPCSPLGSHSGSILIAFVQHLRHLPTRLQALFRQQSNCTHMAFKVHSEHNDSILNIPTVFQLHPSCFQELIHSE